jgi:quercetin dioxygenase-like cupin family protein
MPDASNAYRRKFVWTQNKYGMIAQDILAQLETATNPVAKALHIGEHSKVLLIGFKAGMIMRDHQAHQPSTLVVLDGSVLYTEGTSSVELKQYDEVLIPVNTVHNVEAQEDSLCLLAQG